MARELILDKEYKSWLKELKQKVRRAQLKAAVKVNTEMLLFYWDLGAEITKRQSISSWGQKLIDRLSKDLMAEFPEMKGFSRSNLMYIKKWYLFYSRGAKIVQQPVGHINKEIIQIPWGHNIAIITKCKKLEVALFYVRNVIEHNWSRDVLVHQIESGLHKREGRAITNFDRTLPGHQSDLARQTIKDPYVFDFMTIRKDYDERELENALTEHITRFLLELGAGFSFMGRQVLVRVGTKDFFIDLLFYHARLHCYVVVELKTGDFEPSYAGQLNFYIKAVDSQMRVKEDNPTIGLLLCKNREDIIAEYALSDIKKPIGVSEYKLTHDLPRDLRSKLPTIEEIETEFGKKFRKEKGKKKEGKKKS